MTETYTLRPVRGDDYNLIVRWLDSSLVAVPIDTARLQIRTSEDATTTLLELDETDGLDLSVAGEIAITVTPEQTAVLLDGFWDVEAISDAGQVKTLVRGPVRVIRDVTR